MRQRCFRFRISAFVAYFLLFLTLLAPCHALDHLLHAWTSQSSIEPTDTPHLGWQHNQDICQICKSSGQLACFPAPAAISIPLEQRRAFLPVHQPRHDHSHIGVTSPRSPPSV